MAGHGGYGGGMMGGGGGGGERGGGGGYGRGGSKEVFDGKQLRRAVQRRTVDYNSSAMRWFLDRTWRDDVRDTPSPAPIMEATLDLVLPAAPIMKDNPVSSVCTKFVHSSVNKPRCPINACRWTPEGKRLITGASTGEFTLWNGLTFNFETILQAHDSAVRSMIWSHNEYWMVTGDHQGLIKYWQSNMNNLKAFTAHEESIRDISFAASDLKFASCSDDGAIKVWDFERVEKERALKGHGWDVRCIDWHPQLPIIASGSKDSLVKIWDAKSGKNLTTLHGHKNTIAKVKWNRNGNWLLTGSRDQLIKVFDIRTMREFQTFRGHKREVNSLQWHPIHEDLFVSGAWDGAICYWIMGQDQPVASVTTAHQSSVWDLDWHPLGHILVSASNDHTTKFWTRNRPGDPMGDRALNEAKEEEAMSMPAPGKRRFNEYAGGPKRGGLGGHSNDGNDDGRPQRSWHSRNGDGSGPPLRGRGRGGSHFGGDRQMGMGRGGHSLQSNGPPTSRSHASHVSSQQLSNGPPQQSRGPSTEVNGIPPPSRGPPLQPNGNQPQSRGPSSHGPPQPPPQGHTPPPPPLQAPLQPSRGPTQPQRGPPQPPRGPPGMGISGGGQQSHPLHQHQQPGISSNYPPQSLLAPGSIPHGVIHNHTTMQPPGGMPPGIPPGMVGQMPYMPPGTNTEGSRQGQHMMRGPQQGLGDGPGNGNSNQPGKSPHMHPLPPPPPPPPSQQGPPRHNSYVQQPPPHMHSQHHMPMRQSYPQQGPQ